MTRLGEPEYGSGRGCFSSLDLPFCLGGAVLEPIAVGAALHDMAVMGEPVKPRGGHFRIAEDAGPFREVEVSRDHHAGAIREFAQQMERNAPPAWVNNKLNTDFPIIFQIPFDGSAGC